MNGMPPLVSAPAGGPPHMSIPPPPGATFQGYGGGFDDDDDEDIVQPSFGRTAGRRATPYYPNRSLPPQGPGMNGTFTGHKPTPMWAKSPFPPQDQLPHLANFSTHPGPPQAIPPPFGSQPNTPGLTHGFPTPGSSPGMALHTPPHAMFPGPGGPPPGVAGVFYPSPGGQPPWGAPHPPPMQMHMQGQSPYAGISSRIVEGAYDGFDESLPPPPAGPPPPHGQQLMAFQPQGVHYQSKYGAAPMHTPGHLPGPPPGPPPPGGAFGPPPPTPGMGMGMPMHAPGIMKGHSMPPMMQMMGPPPGPPPPPGHGHAHFGPMPPMKGLTRSNSYPGPPRHGPHGHGHGVRGVSFANDDFAIRRPKDWRTDYRPGGSPLGAIASLLSSPSSDFTDDVKRKPSHLLRWSSANPPIIYDLREPPEPGLVHLPVNGGRPSNSRDFLQLACTPSARRMRLWHRKLPWYIDVETHDPNGISLIHILQRLYQFLCERISHKHYNNTLLGEENRRELAEAYRRRCEELDPDDDFEDMPGMGPPDRMRDEGILKVDFLGAEHYFEGLVRGSKGLWEIKTGARH